MTKVFSSFLMIMSIELSQSQPNLHYDDVIVIADSIQNNALKEGQFSKYATMMRSDSTRIFKKENTSHSLNVQLLGPSFISSIGYAWENKILERLSVQLDFRIAGHTNFGSTGSFPRSYYIGSAMSQSLLIGNRFKMKLGFSEGIVFNPPSIRGKWDMLTSHDRPPRTVFFFSFNAGCEIKLNKTFFITPDANIAYVNLLKMQGEFANEQKYRDAWFVPSFGITLKVRL